MKRLDRPLLHILLVPAEVGLLHRLRPVVRNRSDAVLIRLETPPPGCPGAQVGLAPVPFRALCLDVVTWLGGLSAADVEQLLTAIREGREHPCLALRHRVLLPAADGSRER
ncbi:hypothetical protein CLV92_109144 [Kineococcus xinjiangensis]|uniref:Uncharacterized protein n=1 Tax=Kineococcus xinjiangensis TaxID=512762 RepID=A0A2S6II55_9ACTN|nr:hypothetical protein [Kineococcus xinjiangensis]PPK93866.1 hypothetical protein CLV92_109144 [Kineococcus xinjiangensis]